MKNEIDFYYLNSDDALYLSRGIRNILGIDVQPLTLGGIAKINPSRPFITYNGDGYLHHHTRKIVRHLENWRKSRNMSAFSYVHIDGHDDMASMDEGDDDSYKSFVVGITKDIRGGVFFLEEGLTGTKRNRPHFFTPKIGPKILDWGELVEKFPHRDVYLSIDFDVLDVGSGIHHLFPQTLTGFNMDRLLWSIEQIGSSNNLIGVDFVGFSQKGTTPDYLEQSIKNIAQVTQVATKHLVKNQKIERV